MPTPTKIEQPEIRQPKIMTKPLPEILDELENYVRRVEDAVKLAQDAARDSREAANQAKIAGEKAADAAKKAAEAAIAKLKEEMSGTEAVLAERINGLGRELNALKLNATQEALSLDKAIMAFKERHVEDSPFIEKKK
jgi:predicted translin family RNA/ssDNA-binding protein